MGGHGGLNILPQKSWNVYNRDNRLKVAQDEAKAKAEEDARQAKADQAERDHRRNILLRRIGGLESPSLESRPLESFSDTNSKGALDPTNQHINFWADWESQQPNPEVAAEQREASRRRGKEEFFTSDAKFDEQFQMAHGFMNETPWYARRPTAPVSPSPAPPLPVPRTRVSSLTPGDEVRVRTDESRDGHVMDTRGAVPCRPRRDRSPSRDRKRRRGSRSRSPSSPSSSSWSSSSSSSFSFSSSSSSSSSFSDSDSMQSGSRSAPLGNVDSPSVISGSSLRSDRTLGKMKRRGKSGGDQRDKDREGRGGDDGQEGGSEERGGGLKRLEKERGEKRRERGERREKRRERKRKGERRERRERNDRKERGRERAKRSKRETEEESRREERRQKSREKSRKKLEGRIKSEKKRIDEEEQARLEKARMLQGMRAERLKREASEVQRSQIVMLGRSDPGYSSNAEPKERRPERSRF